MLRTVLGLLFVAVFAGVAAAGPERLSGKTLKDVVAGAVIELDTPVRTTIPMRFGTNGLVSGKAGILAGYLGAAKDRGRWWVEKDRLCIKWFRWFDAQPRCMSITLDGTRVSWVKDDGDRGTGRVTQHSKPAVARRLGLAAPEPTRKVAAKKATVPKKPATSKKTVAAAQPDAAPQITAAAAPKAAPATPSQTKTSEANELPQPGPVTAANTTGSPSFLPSQFSGTPRSAEEYEIQTAALGTVVPVPVPAKRPTRVAAGEPSAKAVTKTGVGQGKRKAKRSKPRSTFRVVRVEADDLLNIRSGPSEWHDAIGIIHSKGRGVKMTGACVGSWCPIRHQGVNGWVHRYYLAKE